MAQSGAPPPEAVRGGVGKGLFAIVVVVVAILAFVGGIGVGTVFLAPPTAGLPAKLFVGTNTPFPPFEFRNETTDNIEGFDIDLITEVLRRMGYVNTPTVTEWELYDFRDFSALLAAVGTGRVDIAVSAITMNLQTGAERNRTMDFTNPYFESDQGVLQRAADTTNYCAVDTNCLASELDGKRVAVQAGTTSDFWATDNLPSATIQYFPDVTQVLQSLQTGAVDIVIIDRPVADRIGAGNPQFAVAGTIQTDELYSFAVANNDPLGLVPLMNTALAAIKADGTFQTLINKWF